MDLINKDVITMNKIKDTIKEKFKLWETEGILKPQFMILGEVIKRNAVIDKHNPCRVIVEFTG